MSAKNSSPSPVANALGTSARSSSSTSYAVPQTMPSPGTELALGHSHEDDSFAVSVQGPADAYSPPLLRARSSSEAVEPWDSHDGGGVATYLPAPVKSPAPRKPRGSPAPTAAGAAAVRRNITAAPDGPIAPEDLSSPLLDGSVSGVNSSERAVHDPSDVASGGDADNENDDELDDDVDDDGNVVPSYQPPELSHAHKLGQWMATGICGNDITSSCLYVTGLCVADAGIWAPVCLAMVGFTLFLFRKVYGEAVTALPLNGGAYNVLLNTTSKSTAAVAACLTILSYVATAVVSGSEAIEYASFLWHGMPIQAGTIVLLSIFAGLNLMGISDSAAVALAIFVTHLCTMFLLIICVVVWVAQHGFDVLHANYHAASQPVLWRSIIFGFSSAMLGVSGFESSANFVEEQKSGVFVKTLRNMWLCVSFFNPVFGFLSLCIMKQDDIRNNQATVLATMGNISAGHWLEKLVSADAFLVLSGGVLTSYVGVTGLCRRLALDRCLPQFLLAENEWRHTNHWIILGFLGVCSSMYLMLDGDVGSLANVYSVSFMSVMGLFAIGNMLLKYKRGKLQREVTAPWVTVFMALGCVILALGGLLAKDASILVVWCLYFLVTGGLVATMFFRKQTLKILYSALRAILGQRRPRWLAAISETIKDIGGQSIGFFAKSGRLSVLNKAILYVRANEDCAWIRIIHVYEDEARIPAKLLRNVHILDECYPKIKIDLVLVPGIFSPDVIDYLSQQLHIPKNLMFITCPKEDFSHKIETLGGVRLITH